MSVSTPDRQPLTVSGLTRLIRGLVEGAPALRDVLVEGELSNLRTPPSGHAYFVLKDDAAVLRCVMFRQAAERLRFTPEDGLKVLARGSVSVFERDGQYQLYVRALEPTGLGSLHLAVEQLKRKLAAEGLFDPARKRRLPLLPRRVALVTSPHGAAVRDMIRIAQRRFHGIGLVVIPVLVQGPDAPESIARGLELVPHAGADAAIVGRGGGSIEELWAFNDERVARAIRACPVPVVSAVGHETDVTIADFAADLRAPTPSAAAELVVPERAALEDRIDTLARRISAAVRAKLARAWQALDGLRDRRVLRDPASALAAPRQRLSTACGRLAASARSRVRHERVRLDGLRHRSVLRDPAAPIAVRRQAFQALAGRLAASGRRITAPARSALAAAAGRLPAAGRMAAERRRAALRTAAGRLQALSPLAVLSRGYSVCRTAAGAVVRRPADAPAGTEVDILLAEGSLGCLVLRHGTDPEGAAR